MLRWLFCILIFFMGTASAAVPTSSEPFYFLALSDIHFDPLAVCRNAKTSPCPFLKRLRQTPASGWREMFAATDTAPPQFKRDANFVLLQDALREAQVSAEKYHPDFVLVLGDSLVHDFRRDYRRYSGDKSMAGFQAFAGKTLEFVKLSLAKSFPDTDVFVVVGNNDTYSANYQSVPRGDFFQQAGAMFSTLIKNPTARAAMRAEFSTAGYYAVDVPNHPDMRLIVLNSVLFSTKSRGEASLQAAWQQMDWLHVQLQAAKDRHQQILIALHIPPQVDMYLLGRIRLFTARQYFQPELLARYKQELAAFYPQIMSVISGHLHYDWSQSFAVDSLRELPVITVPSISPIFGNDPAFKVYHYTPALARMDDVYTYLFSVQRDSLWHIFHTTPKAKAAM
jgi:sphingomyelin phosphodiesterase acid-like 3